MSIGYCIHLRKMRRFILLSIIDTITFVMLNPIHIFESSFARGLLRANIIKISSKSRGTTRTKLRVDRTLSFGVNSVIIYYLNYLRIEYSKLHTFFAEQFYFNLRLN